LVFFGFDNHGNECFASKYPPIPLIKQMHPAQSLFFPALGIEFFGESCIFSRKTA
jgi:hypothetical protein